MVVLCVQIAKIWRRRYFGEEVKVEYIWMARKKVEWGEWDYLNGILDDDELYLF